MKPNNFAALILTHGRPNNVITYDTLRKQGYTGKIIIVIDNEDKQADAYIKKYGKEVVVFDKFEMSRKFDTADNFNDRRSIVFARNAAFDIAKDIGVTYFMQLDDDYTSFVFKFDENIEYKETKIKNLDLMFYNLLKFYKSTNALSVAMAQNGDFIGGGNGSFAINPTLKRKCMNTFICSTERPFQFSGRINEDVNTYTNLGGRGGLFLTVPNVAISQKQTQSNKGGMTDIYIDGGTYIKSFYSVLFSPSCVKVAMMGDKHRRLHHRVAWNNAVPKIIRE